MKIWNDKEWIDKSPIIATIFIEGANIGQMIRIWTEHSAKGQSLSSWIAVVIALVIWFNFYRVITPHSKYAKWTAVVGIILNIGVIISIIWFRYIVIS
jgi:uncharacterized protein with PQ loop repeat